MNKENIKRLIKKHWLNLAFFAVLMLLIFNPNAKALVIRGFFAIGLFKADPPGKPASPSPVYNLSFREPGGRLLTTQDLKGKTVFINFWAHWCPPCRAEMPAIQSLYEQARSTEDLVFLLVNVDGHDQKSEKFLQSIDVTIPVYEPAGPIPEALYSGTLPTTLVVGKDGSVLLKKEGVANYDTKDFLLWLQQQSK